jgi:hypothetical protein
VGNKLPTPRVSAFKVFGLTPSELDGRKEFL